jgi:hypothetical protein
MTSFDCIVIGSGNAGSCAAFSAAESGCAKGAGSQSGLNRRRPLTLHSCYNSPGCGRVSARVGRLHIPDRWPDESRWAGGNGYFTAGAFRTAHDGLQDLLPIVNNVSADQVGSIDMDRYTRDEFLSDIMRLGNGKPDPVLASALVDASRETISWLAKKMEIPFMFSFHRQAYSVGGRQKFWGGLVLCTEDGGKGLIAAHQRALAKAKVDVWFNCPAVEITMEDGVVSGLVVEKHGKKMHLRAPAVVLAAGGFEANPLLRAKHLGAGWERAIVSTKPRPFGSLANLRKVERHTL